MNKILTKKSGPFIIISLIIKRLSLGTKNVRGRERNEGLRVALRDRTAGRYVTRWDREKVD